MIERPEGAERPLPLAARKLDVHVEVDRSDAYALWQIDDAAGEPVAMVVEPHTGGDEATAAGVSTVLMLGATLRAVRLDREDEARARARDLHLPADRPVVAVNVPGVGASVFGAAPPGTVPADRMPMPSPTGRRDLAIVEAMLADALRLVRADIAALDHPRVATPLPEAVALAAQHLDGTLLGGDGGPLRRGELTDADRSALRTVLRAVTPS